MEKFFQLKENNTTVGKEVVAGLTTFFAMAYIIAVNPTLLSQSGMEWGAVFLATIIASVIGTLIMGLVANVPYALAPGMGLNAFFVYTVCATLGFTWQQALSMVFICGVLNIIITVTKIRKYIIKAIPRSLQNAIGGGIGIFVAYIGLLNVGIISFDSGVPALATLNQPSFWLFLIGLALTIILLVCKVKGAILIGIVATALLGIPMGVTVTTETVSFTEACSQLPTTFGAIFTSEGLPSLFSDVSKLPLVLVTIFSFSLSDTFDTIGTFIGTGRRTGIFSEEDERSMETTAGFHSKMDRALFADSIATSIGAILGTSNTTTHDDVRLQGNPVGRLRRGGSGLLCRRLHGHLLQHFLRHRGGIHLLLHHQNLQKAGQTDPPNPLGCDHPVYHQLCPAGHHLTQHGKKKTARPPLPARREGRAVFSLKKAGSPEFCSRAALHVFLLTAIRLGFSG